MTRNVIRTGLQAGDAERLSRVQRQAVMAVLDVRLAGHGINVGLQGKLQVVAAGLHLQRRDATQKDAQGKMR